jgi:hypothetical protein
LFLQTDPNTAFLRAARANQLDKIQEYLDSGTVRDINTSNAVSITLTIYLVYLLTKRIHNSDKDEK